MFFKKKKKLVGEEGIIVKENTMSDRIEGYNRLKDNILYINADGANKVIQVESSVSGEGKTTVISNLAVSLGLTDKKVVVVDLDFRRPRIQQKFGISIDNGISEYMLGTLDKSDIVKHTQYKNVDVVTRGAKIYNSSLVLVSDKFKNFIAELRAEYDFVLLDCAPILQVSDYINISRVSDGVLFIVACGETTRNQVADAIKELRKNNTNILGTVFSKYDRKKDKGYGYYGKGSKGYYSYYRSYLDEENEKDGQPDNMLTTDNTSEDIPEIDVKNPEK